jgi:hypothetical protein
MKIQSEKIDIVSVDSLIPHPKNMHSHSPEQIDRLVKLIEYQGMRNPIIVQKGTNLIVAGHGRLMALKKMGQDKVPVIEQEFESEAQLYAYMVSDNAIGKDTWASLDLSAINTEMLDFGPGFDIDMFGIKDFVLDLSDISHGSDAAPVSQEDLEKYSNKISSPVYTPKKETAPTMPELFSMEKYDALVKDIKAKELPWEVELFLISAASRHIVFNYENIAEFYCHQNLSVQDLMEKSALVIIDFKKAIEGGFVQLTEEIKEISGQNNDEPEGE